MSEDNKTPLAYQFRLRMHELLQRALENGIIQGEGWNPYELGYTVFGEDPLLQESPRLVADIVGYQLGGNGTTEGDLAAIVRGMESRMYNDIFHLD